jgi:two-component system sensor histidine kinase BaeS
MSRNRAGTRRGLRLLAGSGLAARLLVAQALVLVAGALTTWIVATVVGPTIFHDHLDQAGIEHTASETRHIEEAFSSALLISIGLALFAAIAAALAVTWYFTRRVQRSIGIVAEAATGIAAGQYDARVPDPGLGSEFATLATTYNQLAGRLEHTEDTRRRMLSDLAHEMRTPLATVDAHLEGIEDGIREPDASTLEIIRNSTQRLRRLADDIAAVSKAEEGRLQMEPRAFPVRALVDAAVKSAQDRFDAKGVNLQVVADSRRRVLVDPDRLGQVLTNLLDNALRHTPPGGTVTVSCTDSGSSVELTVADTGDGIALEHQDHVFDRFYRVDAARDRVRGGSGIGLSISRALVEAQGGTISVASAGLGRGSTFTVRLPGSRSG